MNRFAVFFICLLPLMAWAQTQPSVDPQGTYITVEGEEIGDASASQSAPLVAHFAANPSNVGDYSARFEWKIWKEGDAGNLLLHRFDEEIDYTFTESGSFRVQLYATFVLGNDTISYPAEGEENPIMVGISTSKLEFPNAISPNDDGNNDKLRAIKYREALGSFEAKGLLEIIKTVYIGKQRRLRSGKKALSGDEKYIQIAEKKLYDEIAFVYSENTDDVKAWVTGEIQKCS